MSGLPRYIDVALVLVILPVALPLVLAAMATNVVRRRPPLYVSRRIGRGLVPFDLYKITTMRPERTACQIMPAGRPERMDGFDRALRRLRIDELPQLWNILKGEMSFIGPRPPLAIHVTLHRAKFARILTGRPGITGLATLVMYRHEHRILAACVSADEAEVAYRDRLLPRKLKIERLYSTQRDTAFALGLLAQSVLSVLGLARLRVWRRPSLRKPQSRLMHQQT